MANLSVSVGAQPVGKDCFSVGVQPVRKGCDPASMVGLHTSGWGAGAWTATLPSRVYLPGSSGDNHHHSQRNDARKWTASFEYLSLMDTCLPSSVLPLPVLPSQLFQRTFKVLQASFGPNALPLLNGQSLTLVAASPEVRPSLCCISGGEGGSFHASHTLATPHW